MFKVGVQMYSVDIVQTRREKCSSITCMADML